MEQYNMNTYSQSERELDDMFFSISVSEMSLRTDRTPEDLQRFAAKLRRFVVLVERLAAETDAQDAA